MFAFLSYPLVIEYSAFLFFMTFLLSLAATISNGYNQSVVTKFITITFTMGFGATSVLVLKYGFDETTAMAYSLYGIIGVAVPVFVLWRLLQIRRFSAIVMTAYGPKVITEYPPDMHTNLDWWAVDGRPVAYRTTTPERLNRALGYDY